MEDLSIGNKLQCCDGKWTCESGVRKSVGKAIITAIITVEMVVEDSGKLDVGSDHNLIWSKVIWRRREVRRRERYKWRLDGKLEREEYQEGVEEVFIGWEEEMRELEQELGGGIVEEAWSTGKDKVIAAAEKEISRKKLQIGHRDSGRRM